MKKTRKSKKWIVAAVVLWMGAYGASVTPKIQKNGWGAAVPRIVIVASLPFLSEEQGSGLSLGIWTGQNLSVQPTGLDQMILSQCPPLMQWAGTSSGSTEFGWFSRRFIFLLAKLESYSLLTDGTTAKGSAYKRLISHLVASKRVYSNEKKWAQQVVYCEILIDQEFGIQEVVRGDFKIRRLLSTSYEIHLGDYGETVYQCNTPNSRWINGFMPGAMPQDKLDAYWINRFLWDNKFEKEIARGIVSRNLQPVFGIGKQIGTTIGEKRVIMTLRENVGTHQEPHWASVHRIDQTVNYTIDPDKKMDTDTSGELRERIQNGMIARLSVDYDSQQQAWVPVVKLRLKDKANMSDDVVLFGGMISICYVRTDYEDGRGRELLRSNHDQTWWRWGKVVTNDPESITVDIEGQERVFTLREPPSVCKLSVRSERNTHLPGELYTQYILPNQKDNHYRLVVRIIPMQGNTQFTYGGLWGNQIYNGELEFPLEKWSYIELKRYMINGVVPDHAMP